MRIGASSGYQVLNATGLGNAQARPVGKSVVDQPAAATEPAAAGSVPAGEQEIDFSNATRRELAAWLNQQVRSGRMTLKDSAGFMAMTLKYSHATGSQVDMASDDTRVNFMDRAQAGIDWSLSRFDHDGAERWRATLATMQKHQAGMTGMDVLV